MSLAYAGVKFAAIHDAAVDLLTSTPEQQADYLRQAKQLSLSLLYWMQTDAPKPMEGRAGKGSGCRKDIAGTEDGLAKAAYVRESRRIQAEFTILEQHVGAQMRGGAEAAAFRRFGRRRLLPDRSASRCGRDQLHRYQFAAVPNSAGRADSQAGRKSASRLQEYRHDAHHERFVTACIRSEWNIGEAAGAVAAQAIRTGQTPRAIHANKKLVEDLQVNLKKQGSSLPGLEYIGLTTS